MFSLKTEIVTPPSFEVSAEHTLSFFHGFFSNLGSFFNQYSTRYSSLKFDDDDEVSSLRYDTLLVNYARTDSISSYTEKYQCQDPSERMAKLFQDPIQPFSLIPHPQWHFQRKRNTQNYLWLSILSTCLVKTRCFRILTVLHNLLIKLRNNAHLDTITYERTL